MPTCAQKTTLSNISANALENLDEQEHNLLPKIGLIEGLWQLLLQSHAQPYTALTIPNQGQCRCITNPLGVLGPQPASRVMASFQLHDLPNMAVHIDELGVH